MQWLALLIGFYIFLLPSFAQPTKWQNLAQRIDSLYEHAYYRDAIPLVQEVVIEAEKTFGRQHANFSASINMLGRLYQMQAKFDLAESLLTRSLQIDQEHSDNNDTIFIQHTLDLVEFFDTRCLYSKAESLLSIAASIIKPSEHHGKFLMRKLYLQGKLFLSQRQFESAGEYFKKALRLRAHDFANDNPDIARILSGLAEVNFEQGRYAVAESLFTQSYDIAWSCFGLEHPIIAENFLGLAEVYETQGKFDLSNTLYGQALEIFSKILAPNDPKIALAKNYIGVVYSYNTSSNYAKAESLFTEAIEVYKQNLSRCPFDFSIALENLASFYGYHCGEMKYDSIKKTYSNYMFNIQKDDCNILKIDAEACKLYEEDRVADAESLLQKAKSLFENTYGKMYPGLIMTLRNLGIIRINDGNFREAEPYFKKSFVIAVKNYGQHYIRIRDLRHFIFRCASELHENIDFESLVSRGE